jgi:hypothetical protein
MIKDDEEVVGLTEQHSKRKRGKKKTDTAAILGWIALASARATHKRIRSTASSTDDDDDDDERFWMVT